MAELWDRVRDLVGRELRTASHLERPFLVLAVEDDALLVRVAAGVAGARVAREYRIARAEVEAAARLHLPVTWRLAFTLLERGVSTAYPAFVAGILRALEEDGTVPVA